MTPDQRRERAIKRALGTKLRLSKEEKAIQKLRAKRDKLYLKRRSISAEIDKIDVEIQNLGPPVLRVVEHTPSFHVEEIKQEFKPISAEEMRAALHVSTGKSEPRSHSWSVLSKAAPTSPTKAEADQV